MKLFKIIGLTVTALLTTSFLITAFMLLYSYTSVSTDKAVIENLSDNTERVTNSIAVRFRKDNSNPGLLPVLAKRNSIQFSEKIKDNFYNNF